jgi:hypothetical protein
MVPKIQPYDPAALGFDFFGPFGIVVGIVRVKVE